MHALLKEAVYELLVARPHVRDGARYGPVEWRAYCRGYTIALTVALETMELAIARWKTRRRHRRASLKEARQTTMRRLLPILFVLLGVLPARAQTTTTTATPSSHFATEITAPDAATAAAYTWRAYVDGAASGVVLGAASCSTSATAGVQTCLLPMPRLSTGTHTATLTAANIAGESPQSAPVTFPFVDIPGVPTNVRIVK